ncbi:hypothetical protein BDF14DRAFT_1808992 [Spinellus fusiger]|nr:hypothetical protein BDF14DRAFT_1808992 [Spinellus fusiger]
MDSSLLIQTVSHICLRTFRFSVFSAAFTILTCSLSDIKTARAIFFCFLTLTPFFTVAFFTLATFVSREIAWPLAFNKLNSSAIRALASVCIVRIQVKTVDGQGVYLL